MQPGDIVPLGFQNGLVILSFVTAFLGSYVALVAAGHIRRSGAEAGAHLGYVAVCALALGGVAIWGMHFIGMQAQLLPFAVGYNAGLTFISFCVAVGFSGFALWYVGSTRFHAGRCLVGGLLAGAGVAAMHYIGIAAMRMPALLQWSLPLVVASVAIAVAAAAAALWLAFNLTSEWQRLGAALVMACAVCGMHYVGVAAGTIVCTASTPSVGWQLGGGTLPYVAFVLCGSTLLFLRWQLHRSVRLHRASMAAHVDTLIDGEAGRAG